MFAGDVRDAEQAAENFHLCDMFYFPFCAFPALVVFPRCCLISVSYMNELRLHQSFLLPPLSSSPPNPSSLPVRPTQTHC